MTDIKYNISLSWGLKYVANGWFASHTRSLETGYSVRKATLSGKMRLYIST